MTVQSSTLSRHSRTYSSSSSNNNNNNNSSMEHSDDKEDRKREYNRLAQREFRRRRKEHLKNLEHAQKEQNSEQSEEIERLRYENDELRRENESLRAQLYGNSASSHGMLSASMASYDNRSYSLSPSASGASVSSSPPHHMGQDLSMASLSMSSNMLNPSMQAYDTSQHYSMVHPSGIRHNSISSPGSSGVRTVRSLGPTLQSLNPPSDSQTPRDASRQRVSGTSNILTPYPQSRAQTQLSTLFPQHHPSLSQSTHHLSHLRTLSTTLPPSLQPTKTQLSTPHYHGIDMIASPTLRDRLLTVSSDVAQEFILEAGFIGGEDMGQLTIWGDDPLNEMTWEFSQAILERWGWLLGREWVERSNWWRGQRGATLLPEW